MRNFGLLSLLLVVFLMSPALTAQPGVEAAPTSVLTGAALPAGALRVTDPVTLRQASEGLQQLGAATGNIFETPELLMWSAPGSGRQQGTVLARTLATTLTQAGYRYQELKRDENPTTTSVLVLVEKEAQRVLGIWQITNDGAVLVWAVWRTAEAAGGTAPPAAVPGVSAPGTTLDGIYVSEIDTKKSIVKYEPDWLTFLPDGRVIWALPFAGLADKAAKRLAAPIEQYGTYTVADDRVIVTMPNGNTTFTRRADGALAMLNAPTARIPYEPVPYSTGLRLDGTYDNGYEPESITFSPDGRFVDTGVQRYIDVYQPNTVVPGQKNIRFEGGTGTYAIEHNSLMLRYDGGVTIICSFAIGVYEDARTPRSIYLWKCKFVRKVDPISLTEERAPRPAKFSTPPPAAGTVQDPGIAGIYYTLKTTINWGKSYINSVSEDWITFFADGQFFEGVPEAGLNVTQYEEMKRNLTVAMRNNCGAYTVNGNEIIVRRVTGNNINFVRGANGELGWRDAVPFRAAYRRVHPCAGLLLEGRYYRSGNTNCPFIQFSPDGRFVEWRALCETSRNRAGDIEATMTDIPGGKGRYSITDYLLTLRYDDGRVISITFYTPPGYKVDEDPDSFFLMYMNYTRK